MSLSATGARRPLQSKPKQNPFLKRASSSFSKHARRKPSSSSPSLKRAKTQISSSSSDDDGDDEELHPGPLVTSLSHPDRPQDVLSLMQCAQRSMFAEIPERGAGMDSVRIAAVLNFRRGLAPIVSVAHLHALSESRTDTEREIAALVQRGVLRRISILGRGRGGATVGDGVVRTEEWAALVERSGLEEALRGKYVSLLRASGFTSTVAASEFSVAEVAQLVSSGFMTSTSALASSTDVVSRAGAFSLGIHTPVAAAGTTAPTGSHDAVGGIGAVHMRGGGSGGLPHAKDSTRASGSLTFAIPGTGSYLRLVSEARTYLVQLLSKSSPRHKEAIKELLRERWDGGIPENDPTARVKRTRGQFVGILPGKTKKWKSFYGMTFDWILEECLGSGAVECFNTGSVGLGVRGT
ncbi:hypothetical protein ANO11243_044890 [Dothideomycetidae sp. 11243]|nr:hypothetical protein ANO11243_044890 [fungal sp. No.11243]